MVPTLRGFTGHEHVDDLRLIHMNGRMYDPQLGRFLSVDPIIQFPTDSQSLNPYSYLGNNPLSGRDPSGYAGCSTGTNIKGESGPDCGSLGVSAAQVGEPSLREAQSALAAKVDSTVGRQWNQYVDAMTAKGASSTPTSGNPADVGASGKTVGGVAMGEAYATPQSKWRLGYDQLSQGNLLDRFVAGVAALGGDVVAPFTSEDEYGNTHNPVTGKPLFAADARMQRFVAIAGFAIPEGKAAEAVQALRGSGVAARGTAVLGKFPDYIKLADDIGGKRFNIPTSVWNRMSSAEQWAANQKFLDRTIARGDAILLSNPVKNLNDVTGSFRRELDYLIGRGFQLSADGTRMVR